MDTYGLFQGKVVDKCVDSFGEASPVSGEGFGVVFVVTSEEKKLLDTLQKLMLHSAVWPVFHLVDDMVDDMHGQHPG